MKNSTRKETGRYIFPNILAKVMAKVSIRTQYESAMMSMTFIVIGLLVFAVYFVGFTNAAVFNKVIIGVNAMAGFVLLSSHLVTQFQQYQNYLLTMGIINQDQTKLEEVN